MYQNRPSRFDTLACRVAVGSRVTQAWNSVTILLIAVLVTALNLSP